jgi:hypothetical protein
VHGNHGPGREHRQSVQPKLFGNAPRSVKPLVGQLHRHEQQLGRVGGRRGVARAMMIDTIEGDRERVVVQDDCRHDVFRKGCAILRFREYINLDGMDPVSDRGIFRRIEPLEGGVVGVMIEQDRIHLPRRQGVCGGGGDDDDDDLYDWVKRSPALRIRSFKSASMSASHEKCSCEATPSSTLSKNSDNLRTTWSASRLVALDCFGQDLSRSVTLMLFRAMTRRRALVRR